MPHAMVSTQQSSRARQLRAAMTHAETLLWRHLKAGHLDGLAFRRQVPMGPYIVDFACHSARIIVELDGESHDFAERQQHDRARDHWLETRGFVVLRFSNDQVRRNLEGVLLMIGETARFRGHAAPPSLSLPRKGGGNPRTPVDPLASLEKARRGVP